MLDAVWQPDAGIIDTATLERRGPFDGVVHLAGAGIGDRRWTAARKDLILTSRTRSTALLADTLADLTTPPGALISASAVGIYGDRGDEEVTETSSTGVGFLADVCRAWEAAAQPAVDAGIRTVLLRSGIVLAPTGGVLGKQLPLFRLGLGGRLGPGTQYRSWITIDDEVGAILHALSTHELSGRSTPPPRHRPPTPVGPGHRRRPPPADSGGRALRRPPCRALGREMADEMILGGQRVLPAVLSATGYPFVHPELGDAVRGTVGPRSLNGQPVPPGRLPKGQGYAVRRAGRDRKRDLNHGQCGDQPGRVGTGRPRRDRSPSMQFEDEARAFLDAHADKRPPETFAWGRGSDSVGLFPERTPSR